MLTFAICDDNIPFCSELEQTILDYFLIKGSLCEIQIFYSGEMLIDKIRKSSIFDVLFLDIDLLTTTGITVGKYIREKLQNDDLYIIYVSSKTQYALQLFQVHPIDFLVKPIQKEKFNKVMDTICRLIERNNNYFEFKIGHNFAKIPLKDILYFESSDKKVNLYNTSGEIYAFYSKLNTIESQLINKGFLRIHKSYLINYTHTLIFRYDEVVLTNQIVLPISQSKRSYIREMHLKIRGFRNNDN